MKIFRIILASALLFSVFPASAEDGVVRAIFTTGIENKEPVDELGQLTTDNSSIYFFTEIRGMQGHTVSHRWEQGGAVRAEVSFAVAGSRWRVWSSKNLLSSWLGEWTVSVVDEGGNVLAQESFAYVPAAQESAATPPVAPVVEGQ